MKHTQKFPYGSFTSNHQIPKAICVVLLCICGLGLFNASGQSPSALYTWDNTGNAAPNVENWAKNFGVNTVTLDNSIFGELHVIETGGAGATVAISDGGNRVRESSTASSGGTDLTGLSYLQFDLGHNGSGNINVQFFVQASLGYNFVGLGPDLSVAPGVNTYQVPLSGLTPAQAVYVRTIGFNVRDHALVGDVTWTLREVRSVGQTLTTRTLANFDGTVEGGLQGAICNFDRASIAGNDGGQNQTGLSWDNSGTGSLQWTDVANGAGGAVSLGNGTAWGGNSFNMRTTDLTGYQKMIIRMSATETTTANGGTLNVQGFFQRNGFSFVAPGTDPLPIDGQFHDLEYSLDGLTFMDVVEMTGINLGSHTDELRINVDNIMFVVPEPTTISLLGMAAGLGLLTRRVRARRA